MNDHKQELFEAELRRMAPARPPTDFMARLVAAGPPDKIRHQAQPPVVSGLRAWSLLRLRWLVPAAAVVIVAALGVWQVGLWPARLSWQTRPASAAPALKADAVRIDRELISAFDAVARLPSGEPVRFRCSQWMDQVVLSNKERGIVIEQRTPRVEVVPVRFETY